MDTRSHSPLPSQHEQSHLTLYLPMCYLIFLQNLRQLMICQKSIPANCITQSVLSTSLDNWDLLHIRMLSIHVPTPCNRLLVRQIMLRSEDAKGRESDLRKSHLLQHIYGNIRLLYHRLLLQFYLSNQKCI